MIRWCLLFLFALVASCKMHDAAGSSSHRAGLHPSISGDTTLFSNVNQTYSGVGFSNRAEESVSRNISDYDYFYNGAGVAIGDLNNDDLPDLFFAGNDTANAVYYNLGDLRFEDRTKAAGISDTRWSTGVTLVDINDDGWLDVYVCNAGPDADSLSTENRFWINQKDGTFIDEAPSRGVNDKALSTQSVFFDMDSDGDLDLWVLNHAERSLRNFADQWLLAMQALPFEKQKLLSNTIYENVGDGMFKDITTRSGLRSPGFGLGIALSDFNGDGLLDVYVANDYFLPDLFYQNQGGGEFKEVSKEMLRHQSFFSMGCDAADINNDGLSDILVLDMTPSDHVRSKSNMNSMDVTTFNYLKNDLRFVPQYMTNMLQLNRGGGKMSEIGHLAGVDRTDWSWAPLIADFDNDGRKDIFITNGIKRDVKNNDWRSELNALRKSENYNRESYFDMLQKTPTTKVSNKAFRNKGDLEFEDVSDDWGVELPTFSNGAAYGDLDLDGDLDLVINNMDAPAGIWLNNSRTLSEASYLQVKLQGPPSLTSGAVVQVVSSSGVQTSEHLFTRGYASYVDPTLHFGLGADTVISTLTIRWGDGLVSVLDQVSTNQRLEVDANLIERIAVDKTDIVPLFQDDSEAILGRNVFHRENPWDDFAAEILLPHKMSRMGPGLAVGDVNGDGLDDFFIGAGYNIPSSIFIQENGQFDSDNSDFKTGRYSEIIDACFIDVDNDADLDLFVASGGGGEFVGRDKWLKDLLYINDGAGNFSLSQDFESDETSSGAVVPLDVDHDGWMDLFVGCRNVPGEYGKSQNSTFYKNEKGKLVDRTADFLGQNTNLGMVTDAMATDLNDDGLVDLMIVGEWMGITVLMNRRSSFEKVEHKAFRNTEGWWRSVHSMDIDGDGDQDFIVGNIGENNKFHPNPEKPLHLFAGDFDDNKSWDVVLSKEHAEQLVPVRGKECSTAQMPFIADRFSSFSEFAGSSIYDILGQNSVDSSLHRVAHTFSHYIIENEGDFNFRLHKMQRQAQMSPLKAMAFGDWNEDGVNDIFLAGNESATEVETVPYDAGRGLVMIWNAENGFESFDAMVDCEELGVTLGGDVKQMEEIVIAGKPKLLVVENAGPIHMLSPVLNE